jgi:hypothetical protein
MENARHIAAYRTFTSGQTTEAAEDKPDRKVAVRECTASADGAIRVLGLKE